MIKQISGIVGRARNFDGGNRLFLPFRLENDLTTADVFVNNIGRVVVEIMFQRKCRTDDKVR